MELKHNRENYYLCILNNNLLLYMERYRYKLTTEIARCYICKKWIENSRELCIVNRKHFHIDCMARINNLYKLLNV
jgi:hypothetical protein